MRKTMEKEIEQWKAVKEDARYVIYDLNNLLRSETTRKQVHELKNRSKKVLKNFKSIQEKWERDLSENMLERERAKKIAKSKKHRVSWGKGKRVRTQKRQMTVTAIVKMAVTVTVMVKNCSDRDWQTLTMDWDSDWEFYWESDNKVFDTKCDRYKHEDSHCVRHCDSEIDSKFSESYSNIEVTETVVGNGAVTVQW